MREKIANTKTHRKKLVRTVVLLEHCSQPISNSHAPFKILTYCKTEKNASKPHAIKAGIKSFLEN